jgi:hypothetical protein
MPVLARTFCSPPRFRSRAFCILARLCCAEVAITVVTHLIKETVRKDLPVHE